MALRNIRLLFIYVVLCRQASAAEFSLVEERRHKVQSAAITEASGLAISPSNPNFMWVVNDSGGTSQIHLLDTDGNPRGAVTIKGVKNIDWEDLASFTLAGKPYLLVADTGDNNAKRDIGIFHVIREPALPAAGDHLAETVSAAWQVQFRFEGGPRDCESVAVDPSAGKILFISKRTTPPEVYQLPLQAPKKRGIPTATPIARILADAPKRKFLPYSNQPTGLDISADGSLAAVLTYYRVFLFHRSPGHSWAEAFAGNPTVLSPHLLGQAESVAIAKDGKSILVISEGRSSPLVRYRIK